MQQVPRHYYKKCLSVLTAVLLMSLLSACGVADEDSKDEDTLTIYNGQHKDATLALIEAFEEETGIEVEERDGSSNELAHQVVEEGDKSPADIIYTEESTPLIMLAEEDMLEEIDDKALEPIPDEYRDSDDEWVGLLARSRVIVYHPELIDENELPSSVLDLKDSKWDDEFAFVPTSGAFQTQISAIIKLEGREAAKEWLEGLKENGKTYKDNHAALEAVERGDIPFALINNYYWDSQAKEKGEENMDSRLYYFGNHDIGDMLTVAGAAILKSSSNKDAAQKFIAFATGVDGQQILTDKSSQYPLNDEADTTGLKPFSELTPPEGTLDLGEYSNGDEAIELLQEVGLL